MFRQQSGSYLQMRKVLTVLLTTLLISGCFPGVYKIDIPQGNIVTQEMVDQLQPGMTYNQVRYVLGTPLVTDTFNDERWDYIYSLKKGGKTTSKERVTLFFEDGRLSGITGDYKPSSVPAQ
jgi:outer membrane protein assembly factor BamE